MVLNNMVLVKEVLLVGPVHVLSSAAAIRLHVNNSVLRSVSDVLPAADQLLDHLQLFRTQ